MKKVIPLIIIVCLFLSAQALYKEDSLDILLSAKAIRFQYDKGAMCEYKNAKIKINITKWADKKEDNIFTIDQINIKTGTARLSGNVGATDVRAISSASGLTFIEKTPYGNYSYTTVFPVRNHENRYFFVQSRHILLSENDPLPSQYYGTCKIID